MTTQREKMLAGELYDASDAELVLARKRARDLCSALNTEQEGDASERRAILQALFSQGGNTASVQSPFFCDYGSNIELGQNVYFNFNCVVLDVCRVRIGAFCLFGPNVQIYTAMHPMNATERRTGLEYGKPITIGNDVWIGGGAIVLPGVCIGAGAVIGAGSVVTRDVPLNTLAAGNPCRVIRQLEDKAT